MKPGVAAALIVRDESRFLRDCLASLTGYVDDVVVIDTGSIDDTVAIAQEFGARIGYCTWCGDFSAARNYALAQVEHEWALYIDADERLLIPDAAAWRACLADRSKAGWRLRLHPYLNWTAYAELRLFRNDPRIRFRGEIHERVHEGVDEVCRAEGLAVEIAEAGLQHVGYEDDQSPKLARNIPLLNAYLARDPSRVFCWWHLGEQHRLMGEDDAARAAWAQGVEAVRRQGVARTTPSESIVYLSLIGSIAKSGGDTSALLAEARALFPDHHGIAWQEGKIALERGDLTTAQQIFARLAKTDAAHVFDEHIAYDRALFTHTAQESLGLTAFRAGNFAAAAKHYHNAAATAPDPMALRVKAALAEAKARGSSFCEQKEAKKLL